MGFAGKCVGVVAILAVLGGCQTGGHQQQAMGDEPAGSPPAEETAPSGGSAAAPGVSAADLQTALAELDKGHHDKMKLAWYVSSPFKSVTPAMRPFYKDMGTGQKELATELEDWAKEHHVDLTYHYGKDPMGQAQKIMEDASSKEATSVGQEDFERDMMMNMRQDYLWDASLDKSLLKRVTDPALKSYLEKSLKSHEEGLVAIRELLKKYKFEG